MLIYFNSTSVMAAGAFTYMDEEDFLFKIDLDIFKDDDNRTFLTFLKDEMSSSESLQDDDTDELPFEIRRRFLEHFIRLRRAGGRPVQMGRYIPGSNSELFVTHNGIPTLDLDPRLMRDLAEIRRMFYDYAGIWTEGILDELDFREDAVQGGEAYTDLEPIYPRGEYKNSECQVCFEIKDLYLRICCNFPVCDDCLKLHFTAKINERTVKVVCCNPLCDSYVHRDEIVSRLDIHMKERFHRFLIEANKDPKCKTCPRCSHVLRISSDIRLSSTKAPYYSKVWCPECSLIWCFVCHSPWHEGISCKEFKKGDKLLKTWAKELHHGQLNAQKCPKCKTFVQRTTGCDHMQCARCKTHFCYRCGDRFRSLKFFGDHYSKLSIFGCKFRFKADKPLERKLVRGVIFGGKILVAPIAATAAIVVGGLLVAVGPIVLPIYGVYKFLQYKKDWQDQRIVYILGEIGGRPVLERQRVVF